MFTKETTTYLELLSSSHTIADLHRFKALLNVLGNPEEKLRCIHIAGTNGKGSTASFITSILQAAHYKVGLYTSPDLLSVIERIRIGNDFISEENFERLLAKVREAASSLPDSPLLTYFEAITAVGFLYYAEQGCDVVVLETGLGGRYDATNVIASPLCSVLTTISYDHTQRLGHTLQAIASQKAGIIKPYSPTICYPQEPEALEVITTTCKMQHAPLHLCHLENITILSSTLEGQVFTYKSRSTTYDNLAITLLGRHQCFNAALAIEVMEVLVTSGLTISKDAIYEGLAQTKWPGRLEIIHHKPLFVIDGAHNVQGTRALRDALLSYFSDKKIIYLFGSLKDKDYEQTLELTMPLAETAILVTPPSARAVGTDLLEAQVKVYCPKVYTATTLEEGTHLALSLADEESVIVAFGSLYFIGELPKILEASY